MEDWVRFYWPVRLLLVEDCWDDARPRAGPLGELQDTFEVSSAGSLEAIARGELRFVQKAFTLEEIGRKVRAALDAAPLGRGAADG